MATIMTAQKFKDQAEWSGFKWTYRATVQGEHVATAVDMRDKKILQVYPVEQVFNNVADWGLHVEATAAPGPIVYTMTVG